MKNDAKFDVLTGATFYELTLSDELRSGKDAVPAEGDKPGEARVLSDIEKLLGVRTVDHVVGRTSPAELILIQSTGEALTRDRIAEVLGNDRIVSFTKAAENPLKIPAVASQKPNAAPEPTAPAPEPADEQV